MGKYLKALKSLDRWFERQKRLLPWRDEPTLYRVWISEIMLQQTQVATVIPYFEKFMKRFPRVEDLAAAPVDEVLLMWAGLGYYSRARNLHRAAQTIVEHGGFPRTRADWLEIPGVGEYTAGAILSIALDQPEAILDGNVERVLSRVRKVNRQNGDSAYKQRLWRLARAFVRDAHRHKIQPSVTNQALMELGATYCSPKKPTCMLCPLAGICRAQQAGEQESYPPKKKPKKWIEIREELHCLVDDDGRLLVRKRAAGEWRAGLWDFLDEVPSGAKLGAKLKKIGSIETKHVVTRHKVQRTTHVWKAIPKSRVLKAAEKAAGSDTTRWIRLDPPEVAVGSALKRTLMQIRERFPEALPGN